MKKILAVFMIVGLLLSFGSCKKENGTETETVEISQSEFMELYSKYHDLGVEYKVVDLKGTCYYMRGHENEAEIPVQGAYDIEFDGHNTFIHTDYMPEGLTENWKLYLSGTPESIENTIKSFSNSGEWKFYRHGNDITMTVSHENSVLMSRTYNECGYLMKETGGYNEVEIKSYSE